jgi:hypothetical protein
MFSTIVIRRCIVKRVQAVSVTLAILLVLPCLVFAYGDGAATGSVKNGLDSGKVCRCETLDEVRQGQRWHTRPETLKNTAYEFLSSFQDAERNLLDNYDQGDLTKDEVKDILQWLKDNKMYMSDKALKVLNTLAGTAESTDTKSPKISSSAQSPETTSGPSGTAATTLTPQDKAKISATKKFYAYFMQGPQLVSDTYIKLRIKHPKKNHFALNDMVYRQMFTKEERNVIQSELKVYLGVMHRIDKLTR